MTADEQTALAARLQVPHCRERRLANMQRLAVASLPAWFQAHRPVLPSAVLWLALLIQGYLAAEAGLYAALELRARRRAGAGHWPSDTLHLRSSAPHGLRAALWHTVGFVALAPWLFLGAHRLPAPWLVPLTLVGCALAALALLTELTVSAG